MKIFVGYFLLIGLVLTAAALVYMEYRNIECAVQEEEQTAERWKQANRTFETMYDLAMSELHTFTADKEDYEEYELKNLAAQQMLDSLKRLYPEEKQLERIDSAKSILAEKSLQVLCMMRTFNDLAHTDSLIECQIREMTLVEQKAIRELKKDSEQKKDSWIGRLFKKKSKKQEPVEQATESRTQVVGRLTKLRKEISERNEDLRLRMEMQTDSLRLRNEYLNKNFARLMHEFQQASTEQRAAEMEEMLSMRRHSFFYIAGLTLFGMLLSFVLYNIIHRDIRRRYRERLKLIAWNEEKQEMLEQKERMMMILSHELRSPLAAVMGYAELMQDTNDTTISTAKRNILRAARMMQGLLNSLLYYYRLSSGKDRVNETLFLPKSIADELESMFLLAAEEKGIDLHADFEGENVLVSGDKERILQIGQNLMSNAVKFTEEGGVSLLVRYAEGTLLLEVCDTGTGISKEEQNAIYEPFSRLANADVKDGFGLGLSITRKLVALLNGDISLESEVCQGTTFRVTLPLSLATETENESHQESFHFSKDMRMIAVDDDAVVLKLTQRQLERVGLECDTCQNVEELMERLRKREYDLLLTDIKMPGMNGYELLDLLRCSNIGNSKNIPVLAVTAHISRKEEELVKAGFAGCLYKPFSCDELYAAVRHALREKRKQVKSDMDDMEAIDFTPLLANEENGRDMLALLAEQTRKDMESLRRVHDSHDREALADLTHHLLPVWTMLRIDTCLQALRNAYRKDSAGWADVARYIDKVIATGEQLVAQAEKGIETYGEEWRRKVRY
ncbi:hybrid sensor histidine kinase/response regulator [Bacteroides uniformis]|jgi:signal transduction histidine kinase/DNA-binding response OmpR family regulator|uniref:ATP-binding response regulator n=1 Tax=Bacteroides uniformis TaxID=820 RepID=UPI0039B68BF1